MRGGRGFGDGIPARGAERSAPHQPAHRQPYPTPRAVRLDRLERVRRAGGREATGRRAAVDRSLVPDDGAHHAGGTASGRRAEVAAEVAAEGAAARRTTERTSASRSRCSSVEVDPAASGRAPIRYQPDGSVDVGGRAASRARSRRRTWLRTTAGPTARPIANATRGGDADGSGRKVHHSTPARVRSPSRDRRAKTLRSRMRQIKPTACAGPWRGEPSTRRGRRGCSSGHGSRACGHGGDCSAGRCASRDPPGDGHRSMRWGRRCASPRSSRRAHPTGCRSGESARPEAAPRHSQVGHVPVPRATTSDENFHRLGLARDSGNTLARRQRS